MTTSKFQTHCEQLVAKLSKDKTEHFKTLSNDAERIKFLYTLSNEVNFDLATWSPKDFDRAEALKINGNKLFQQRSNFQAVSVYNEAITRCPQDDIKGKELYAVLVANRSAVFFDNGEYQKVLQDVAFLKQDGHHPNMEKIKARETKTLDAIYKETQIDTVLEFEEDGTIKLPLQEELSWISKNITYPALSNKLTVKREPHLGRYIVAKDDIRPGEILAVEKAYAAVLTGSTYRTNCGYCALSTNQIHACTNCCQAVYCSLQCLELAKTYHQHECAILLTLFDCGVSVNNLLALRMITQRPLQQVLKEQVYASEDRNIVIYKTEDYYNVTRLVWHEDSRESEEMQHLTFMATFLLKLLKTTDYFGSKTDNLPLSDNEILVGGLLLKYLQILQYNAHEIFELQNILQGDAILPSTNGQMADYKTAEVGAGVYPTLALFNHSCDPSVIRYNIKNTMILRSIKPIKAGDIVYENYGPLYMTKDKETRIREMASSYKFKCACQACLNDWPLFTNLDGNILRILCDCGGVIPTSKEIPTPSITCQHCRKEKNLLPVLTGLIPLEAKSAKAENLFIGGHFDEAKILYAELLQTQLKYLVPPFGDMVLLQQRLKDCLIHYGNKKFDYKI